MTARPLVYLEPEEKRFHLSIRDDVPVAGGHVAVQHGESLAAVEVYDAAAHCVHRRAIGGGDVDPK